MSNHNPSSYIDFFPFPVPLPFFSVGGQSVFCHCPLLTFVQGFLARRTLEVLCFHISSMWCSDCCPSAAPAHCLEDLSDLRFHGIALQDDVVWPPEVQAVHYSPPCHTACCHWYSGQNLATFKPLKNMFWTTEITFFKHELIVAKNNAYFMPVSLKQTLCHLFSKTALTRWGENYTWCHWPWLPTTLSSGQICPGVSSYPRQTVGTQFILSAILEIGKERRWH